MKAEIKFWEDTKNLDLILTPENPTEEAMLGLLRDRQPRWYAGVNGTRKEIIFEPNK